jgi:hypothetical protein
VDETVEEDNAGVERDDLQPERPQKVEGMVAGRIEAGEAAGQAGRPQVPPPAQLHVLDTKIVQGKHSKNNFIYVFSCKRRVLGQI